MYCTKMPSDKITGVQKAYARLLRIKHSASYEEIAEKCKISKSSCHRICNMAIDKNEIKKKGENRKATKTQLKKCAIFDTNPKGSKTA